MVHDPIVIPHLLTQAADFEKRTDWLPFKEGVQIITLYTGAPSHDGTSPVGALLKYEAGATVPAHLHTGYEHILILSGSQIDRLGEHFAGTMIINPPGSTHDVISPNGCIVLAIWEKPVIFAQPQPAL